MATQAALLTDPYSIDLSTIEAESRPLFRVQDKYEVRQCTDGSRVVVYDSGDVDDYATLEASVIEALLQCDEGAYGTDPAAVAEDWIRAGYDPLRVGEWLAVGVAAPDLADRLAAEGGYAPEDLRGAFHGWATEDAVVAFMYGSGAKG